MIRDCDNCLHCLQMYETYDYFCTLSSTFEKVYEDGEPTEDYNWCGGELWEEN